MRKQAQMELDAPPMGDSGFDSEPDFDGMAGDMSRPEMESPLEEPMDEAGPNLEDAKQSLADALIALCGGVEQAMDCLQSGDVGAEMPDELDEAPLDADLDDDFSDDVIPGDLLESEPNDDMMKPMNANPEMGPDTQGSPMPQQQQQPMF
jgi:hypothetical protein